MLEITSKNTKTHFHIGNTTSEFQPILTACRFTGKDYLSLSQLIQITHKGKGKLSHLLSTEPKPRDPTFDTWNREDSMIMAWL